MKRSLPCLALLFVLSSPLFPQAAPRSAEPSPLRVGAYNIQIFGTTKASRPNVLTVLAEIAASYDLLAIEEVGSNGSTASDETCAEVMDEYTARINAVAGSDRYAYVRGNQYAIVYRKAAFSEVRSSPYEGSREFTYRPLTAYFKTSEGNLDFCVVVVHTSPRHADVEIPALKTAMAEVSAEYGEPDVVCMGDFNGDGYYFNEGSGQDLADFPEGSYITVIPNSADTTVAASSRTYDRMELSESMKTDYTTSWGVVEPAKLYDLSRCEGTKATTGTEKALSDHYPIWAEFYRDRDTD